MLDSFTESCHGPGIQVLHLFFVGLLASNAKEM